MIREEKLAKKEAMKKKKESDETLIDLPGNEVMRLSIKYPRWLMPKMKP